MAGKPGSIAFGKFVLLAGSQDRSTNVAIGVYSFVKVCLPILLVSFCPILNFWRFLIEFVSRSVWTRYPLFFYIYFHKLYSRPIICLNTCSSN